MNMERRRVTVAELVAMIQALADDLVRGDQRPLRGHGGQVRKREAPL